MEKVEAVGNVADKKNDILHQIDQIDMLDAQGIVQTQQKEENVRANTK